MRKVKCKSGHFYDADRNELCPHCGLPEMQDEQKAVVTIREEMKEGNVKSKRGFLGKKKVLKNEMPDIIKVYGDNIEDNGYDGNEQKTYSLWSSPEDNSMMSNGITSSCQEKMELSIPKAREIFRDIDDVKTVSKYADTRGIEPVTGWLVCIKGDNYGKSYEIPIGQNCIGRDSSMEICIKDQSISREKQAYLIYEPKKSQFFLRSGDGTGLTYHNDELICGMVLLNAYDRIQLGDAEFLFVPFCGENFVWTNN